MFYAVCLFILLYAESFWFDKTKMKLLLKIKSLLTLIGNLCYNFNRKGGGIMFNIQIRDAVIDDAEKILEIYSPYVKNTAISFEYEPPKIDEFKKRIENILNEYPYLVAVHNNEIIGFAYASRFHIREAFKYSAELSVYIKSNMRKLGIGRKLYDKLEKILKQKGIINLYACVAYSENEDEFISHDSVIFHELMGFKTVGKCNKCGYKFNKWYDILYMEKFIGSHK